MCMQNVIKIYHVVQELSTFSQTANGQTDGWTHKVIITADPRVVQYQNTPRGGTLIFSHIRRLGPFFGVQNSEFQYFLGFSERRIFLWGMKILWIFFFWGHHKIGLV